MHLVHFGYEEPKMWAGRIDENKLSRIRNRAVEGFEKIQNRNANLGWDEYSPADKREWNRQYLRTRNTQWIEDGKLFFTHANIHPKDAAAGSGYFDVLNKNPKKPVPWKGIGVAAGVTGLGLGGAYLYNRNRKREEDV